MRLRLVIQRHSLPDTPVAWAIDTTNSPTISQLLEQVNEILPLESGGDWGLEDYSVEIKGSGGTNFECLHFQQVASILHEDDEVVIRPLQSLDLKLRKVSGRQQITSDGRHLFDGSVFGRPRPRGIVDRPAVEIPPRKRRRITFEEDSSDTALEKSFATDDQLQIVDDEQGNRQLVLRADFEDDDDDEDDEDFEVNEEEEDEDMDDVTDEDLNSDSDGQDAEVTDEEMRVKVRSLREAFPKAPVSVCEHVLLGSNGDLAEAWESLSRGFKPTKAQRAIVATPSDSNILLSKKTRSKGSIGIPKDQIFAKKGSKEDIIDADEEESSLGDEDLDHAAKSLLEHYDQHGLPPGSISTTKTPSKIPGITTKKLNPQTKPSSRAHRSISTTSSTKSVRFADGGSSVQNPDEVALDDEDESDDDDFSSGESSDDLSDSSSDSSEESDLEDDDEQTSSSDSSSGSSSSSSSSDDSDSDSDSTSSSSDSGSEPEVSSSKSTEVTTSKTTSPSKPEKSAENSKAKLQPTVPPGRGKRATQRRNARRRLEMQSKRYKEKGIIPAGYDHDEFQDFDQSKTQIRETPSEARTSPDKASAKLSKSANRAASRAAELEARRAQLISSIASGGVDVTLQNPFDPPSNVERKETEKDAEVPIVIPLQAVDNNSPEALKDAEQARPITETPQDLQLPAIETPSSDSTPRVRKKLNIGAAGRLLFGALGVRAPKNKEDREKVRNDLMKHVRPVRQLSTEENNKAQELEELEDPEAWREVITLRAVECCHEGIELTPAPFPFVQRWDPQQQGSYPSQAPKSKRGGKGKRKQRDQLHYYEYEDQQSSKKQRHDDPIYYDDYSGVDQDISMEVAEGVKGVSDGVGGEANDQLMKDAEDAANTRGEAVDEVDLPTLPEDMSKLPSLLAPNLKVGMVVAFKQLTMSEETNWQPQISAYRTATITNVDEKGEMELTLAWRDRQEKYYDEETGERLYGKFDVPIDDDQDEIDDGFLSVTFAELLEPKLVQAPPAEAHASPNEPSLSEANGSTVNSIVNRQKHADESEGEPVAATTRLENRSNGLDGLDDIVAVGVAEDDLLSYPNPLSMNEWDLRDLSPGEFDFEARDDSSVSIRGGDLASFGASDHDISISEDAQRDISQLMREAGFRSTVPSSVLRAISKHPMEDAESSLIASEDLRKVPYSPRFNGFNSDPASSVPVEIIPSQTSSIDTPQPFLRSSPPPVADIDESVIVDEIAEAHSTISSVHYPKLSIPSSLASEVADYGRQPDFPTPGDETLERFEADGFLPGQGDSAIGNDEVALPATYSNGDDFDLPPSSIRQSENSNSYLSDGGLPTLEEIFSTARSQSIQPKRNAKQRMDRHGQPLFPPKEDKQGTTDNAKDSYNEAMAALDADILGDEDDPEQVTPRASQRNTKVLPKAEPDLQAESWKERTKPKAEALAGAEKFVVPPGSQHVDLTLSSDIDSDKDREADALYDDLFGKPKGPGGVAKKRTRSQSQGQSQSQAKRQSSANTKASTQTDVRTRSVRRKTTTRF